MRKGDKHSRARQSPGTWSTDDYIRRWAQRQGLAGECLVPLQSLHNQWQARINFEEDGQPVERTMKAEA